MALPPGSNPRASTSPRPKSKQPRGVLQVDWAFERPIDLQHTARLLALRSRAGTRTWIGSRRKGHCGFYIANVFGRKLFSAHGLLAPYLRLVWGRGSSTSTTRLSQ